MQLINLIFISATLCRSDNYMYCKENTKTITFTKTTTFIATADILTSTVTVFNTLTETIELKPTSVLYSDDNDKGENNSAKNYLIDVRYIILSILLRSIL
jgi:hypothetical protein